MVRAPAERSERVWRALASATRRAMLDVLRDGPATTGALAERFPGVSRFAVMQHLKVLVAAGLVVAERRGRERVNTLNPVPIRQIYERWVSKYADGWSAMLTGIKERAETAGLVAPPGVPGAADRTDGSADRAGSHVLDRHQG